MSIIYAVRIDHDRHIEAQSSRVIFFNDFAIHSNEKTETEHSHGLYSRETFCLIRAYHTLCNYVFLFHSSILSVYILCYFFHISLSIMTA